MGGISATTKDGLVYGTNGYVTVDGTDLGATSGDFAVEWTIEHYYPDIAQALVNVAGTGRVTKGTFSLKVTLTEWTYAVLSKILATYGASSDSNSETLGGGSLGAVTEVANVVLTGITRNDGKAVMVTIPQAYVEAGSPTFSKTKETSIEVTFHGLATYSAPDKMPGKVQFAK